MTSFFLEMGKKKGGGNEYCRHRVEEELVAD